MTKIFHITSAHPRSDTRVYERTFKSIKKSFQEAILLVADGKGSDQVNGIIDVCSGQKRAGRIKKIFLMLWEIKGIRDSVLHFHDPELIPIMIFSSKTNRVIFDVHEHFLSSISSRQRNWIAKFLVKKFLQFWLCLAGRRFHFVLAEHSYTSIYVSKKSNTVIRNMPDRAALKPFFRSPKKIIDPVKIVYVGSISIERGVEQMKFLLEANNLGVLDYRIQLHLVGDGPALDNLPENQFCKKYGRKSFSDSYKIASECHFGLCLLAPTPNYLNSIPTKMFEYDAINLPFFVSDFPYYKKLCNDLPGAIPVKYESPDILIEQLNLYCRQERDYEKLHNQHRCYDQWSWKAESQVLLDLYSNIFEIKDGK